MAKELLFCGHVESEHNPITRGYGIDNDGNKHCYDCCLAIEVAAMRRDKKAILYLIDNNRVTNWIGNLSIKIGTIKKSSHNIARNRYDFWFVFDGHVWHGVQYGANTQIAHCKQTKTLA